MENASKALIIAGAVLIAIMIISLGVLIFNKMSGTAKEMADMSDQEVSAFNSKITPYLGESVSGSQVNALIQLVISTDLSAIQEIEQYKVIKITFPTNTRGIGVNADCTGMDYGNNVKRVETGAGKYYKVRGTIDNNGLITTIVVTE